MCFFSILNITHNYVLFLSIIGGGVALETSPLSSETNEVKYMQSQLSDNGDFNQAQEFAVDKLKDQADMTDMKKMTESEGLLSEPQSENNQQSLLGSASAAANDSPSPSNPVASPSSTEDLTASLEKSSVGQQASSPSPTDDLAATLEKANAAASSPLPSEATDTSNDATALAGDVNAGGEDGIAKSLSKAGGLSTDAVMNLLKAGKVPGTDFSNAEVSPGPDPYENTADAQQSTAPTDESLSSLISEGSKQSEGGDDLAGGLAGSLESSNSQLGDGGSNLSQMMDSSSLEGSDPTLSSRSPDSQQDAGESEESEFQRNTIPNREDTFRRSFNTEIFKKHIIMRPKRDTYVSPFRSKEAFDTAI